MFRFSGTRTPCAPSGSFSRSQLLRQANIPSLWSLDVKVFPSFLSRQQARLIASSRWNSELHLHPVHAIAAALCKSFTPHRAVNPSASHIATESRPRFRVISDWPMRNHFTRTRRVSTRRARLQFHYSPHPPPLTAQLQRPRLSDDSQARQASFQTCRASPLGLSIFKGADKIDTRSCKCWDPSDRFQLS